MTGKTLVIVESPTKASKIGEYLGKDYIVESSRGHIRDLPESSAQVPAKYKGEKWARTGVDVDDDFKPLYVVNPSQKSNLKVLKDRLKEADGLLLATDGDREGEAIAWHLYEELKPKVPTKRMVFHEITRDAIVEAVRHPRDIDMALVDAQEARRIVDRLYGFEVSPVLWKKVRSKLSAGRVQSVAMRLVVDREKERIAFTSANYWGLDAELAADATAFTARLQGLDDAPIAVGKDFDASGRLTRKGAVVLDEQGATTLASALEQANFEVTSVESRPYTRRPYAPFRTTTLQQDAGRKLSMSADTTMRVAQRLYEGGFITYMRTDSVTLSSQATQAARAQAVQLYGAGSVPDRPRVFASKVKNAQEAHEAIRPAGDSFRTPAQTGLSGEEYRLYELIWQRTVASQMIDASGNTLTVRISADPGTQVDLGSLQARRAEFVASGRTITEMGFLKAYVVAVDEGDADDAQSRLPELTKGQQVQAQQLTPAGHDTRPPSRYTEPSLVAKLEELEIGRPSTYAAIIRTLLRRDYVWKKGSALVPTWLAFSVTKLLEQHFPELVDYDFTAKLEDILDEVAKGDETRLQVLRAFFFGNDPDDLMGIDWPGLDRLVNELGEIDARAIATFPIGDLDSGIEVRVGRSWVSVETTDGERRASLPDDLAPDELTVDKARELLANPNGDIRELGLDPLTHNPVVVRNGRYGLYVTEVLDDDVPKGAKPRRGSLLGDMDPQTMTLEDGLKVINLPRLVGVDDDGTEILTGKAFSAYVKKGSDYRTLESEEQIFTLTLDQAKAILAQPKTRGRAAAAAPLKELGNDPVSGNPVVVKSGRFGPYVTDGEFNATLRKDDSPQEMTLERAAELLAEKRAKGPAPKRKAPARKTAAKKTTTVAKKAPAKKTAAKKTTTAKTTAAKATGAKATTAKKSTTTRKPASSPAGTAPDATE